MNWSAVAFVTSTKVASFTTIDLFVLVLVIPLWTWGILAARKRRLSRALQIIYTLTMLGGACGDVILGQMSAVHPNKAFVIGSFIWLVGLGVGGAKLIPKRRVLTYPCFGIGFSLIYLSFFISGLERLFRYGLLLIGFLLVGTSMILSRSGENPRPVGNGDGSNVP